MFEDLVGDILDRFGQRKAAKKAAEQLSKDQQLSWDGYWKALMAIISRPEMQTFGLVAATGEVPRQVLGDLEDAGVLRAELELARTTARKYVDADQLFGLEQQALDLLVDRVVDDDGIVDQREYGQVFACSSLLGADRMSPRSVARFQFGRVNAGFLPDPVVPQALLLKRGEACYFDQQAQLVKTVAAAGAEDVAVPLGGGSNWVWRGAASQGSATYAPPPKTIGAADVLDTGRFALTDRRLVFTGSQKSIDMRLSKLNAAWVAGSVLKLHRSDRVKPTLFSFPDANEDLAASLLVLLTRTDTE